MTQFQSKRFDTGSGSMVERRPQNPIIKAPWVNRAIQLVREPHHGEHGSQREGEKERLGRHVVVVSPLAVRRPEHDEPKLQTPPPDSSRVLGGGRRGGGGGGGGGGA